MSVNSEPHRRVRCQGPLRCAASRYRRPRPISGCSTSAARPTGCTPIPGGGCASRPSSSRIRPAGRARAAVAIFGSARTQRGTHEYQTAEAIASGLVKAGSAVITGGGPAIMEAANKGAVEAGGVSVGLGIELPMEMGLNDYVEIGMEFRYFFARKTCFIKYSQAFVVTPGGYGSMDELFEALTLVATGKITKFPIVPSAGRTGPGCCPGCRTPCWPKARSGTAEFGLIRRCRRAGRGDRDHPPGTRRADPAPSASARGATSRRAWHDAYVPGS